MYQTDTIAAIATAMNNSGIGIIRVSGVEAIAIVDKIFKGKLKLSQVESHTINYGHIINHGEMIDEVMVSVMRAPRTYTREDVVEINCHGGVLVMSTILQLVYEQGARPAEPGEFTKRAFLNGRIDLSQAESVMDIISSKNEFALKSSINQLQGSVKNKIIELREAIIYEIAYIESALDDPEHISLDGYSEQLKEKISVIYDKIKKLLDSADNGAILKEGINTVIIGKPNAGKSSLLNALAKKDRAIVTEYAGTTRDILEEQIMIHGISLNILDTAGIRETDDYVEQIGVTKALESLDDADFIIYVVDSSTPLDENDMKIMNRISNENAIVLLNKSDLTTVTTMEDIHKYLDKQIISISTKNLDGIDELEQAIKDLFFHGKLQMNDEVFITNARHKMNLSQAYDSLSLVLNSIDNHMPEDFYSIDLMDAYEALGNIIGESVEEDLVNEIFHKFCMGK